MIVINTVSSSRFSIDGIEYFKNFMPIARGNTIAIINAYDSKIDLSGAKAYDQFNIDSVVYATLELTQSALLSVLFSRVAADNVSPLIRDLNSDDSIAHTGDLLQTIVKTYTIPANTIPSNCVISALIAIKKVGGLNSGVFEFGLSGQSNGLFHLVNMGNNPYVLCERKFTVKNGQISCLGVSGSTFNDVGVNSTRFSFAFDVAASNDLDLRFRLLNAGDDMILDYVQINIL